MLKLRYKLKSATHEIPLHVEKALASPAFATYTERQGDKTTHVGLGWTLESTHDGRYEGHAFELIVTPEHVDRLIVALQEAQKRFHSSDLSEMMTGIHTRQGRRASTS